MSTLSVRIAAVPVLALALMIQGCGEKKSAEGGKDTQVAAKINGDEITVSQINNALQRSGNIPQDKIKDASKQVLTTLINQELLVQKAISDKLDRNPNVLQTIEAAKNQILAEAYIQSKTESLAKPTDSEITEFYNKHPELFSDRRAYRLQEITIEGAVDKADEIRSQLTASKNLEEFAKWLKEKNFKFGAAQIERAAEQLPQPLAARLVDVKPGQAIVINNNGNLTVMLVAAVAAQPINAEQAKPAIEKILTAQKRKEFADSEIKSLRGSAKIEYMGDFADMGKEVEQQPAEPAASAPAPASSATENAPAKSTEPANPDADAIKKGLSGLK